MSISGGTEAFPDLGRHCQHPDCLQLDFLPFECDACHMVVCLEHRSYNSHECPKSDINSRKVLVCEICSSSIEKSREFDEKTLLENHAKSGNCDPKKKIKRTCSVKQCKEILTFSNTSICKSCEIKVCLKHRFPIDHACSRNKNGKISKEEMNNMFLTLLASKNGGNKKTSPPSTPTIKAY